MDNIEFSRVLVPLLMCSIFVILQRHKEKNNRKHKETKNVNLSFFGQIISWFSILISTILLSQIFIDTPDSVAMVVLFILFIAAALAIGLQQLSLRIFFDNKGLAVTSLFSTTKTCNFSDVISVKEKRYSGNGARVFILQLANQRIRIPISMLSGLYQHELEALLQRINHQSQVSND